MSNSLAPKGSLSLVHAPIIRRPRINTMRDAIRYGVAAGLLLGNSAKAQFQRANIENFRRSLVDQRAFQNDDREVLKNRLGVIGHLWLAKVGPNGVEDLGLASCRVVTTAGVNYIVDAFQNLVELEDMKYHGLGTGTAAESIGNTALTSELSTQYSTSNTRPTGTTGEQSGNANVYETSATITVSAASAVTEHGIFSRAATGGGVLLDRSVFAAVNLAAGESLQATYSLTFPSGG